MPYEFLSELTIADIAFHAWGQTLEELFMAAGDALMNVMVDDIRSIERRESRTILIETPELELLLFDALQELIYYKDSQQLLLRFTEMEILHSSSVYHLSSKAEGEKLDPLRHEQRADVKAVTFHQFCVAKKDNGWEATVVLDI
jgi:SHS2 domain-containing protein